MPAHPRPAEFDQMMAIGQAVAGNPDTVRRFLQAQVDESAANYLVGQFAFGDLTLAESLRTVDWFKKEVMATLKQRSDERSEVSPRDTKSTKVEQFRLCELRVSAFVVEKQVRHAAQEQLVGN